MRKQDSKTRNKIKLFIRIKKYVLKKITLFLIKFGKRFISNDSKYLKLIFRLRMGKKLNLNNPTTFNEKLQWLKLYDQNDFYTSLVDKYEVKKYVSNLIGKEYIIPTLGIYNNFDEIDFSKLPNEFVIKCTHDSGGIVICKDKKNFDLNKARKKINKRLNNNFYYNFREWVYKNVKPRIIVEKYMGSNSKEELVDYKFLTFNGRVEIMYIASNRNGKGDTYFDFFDRNFNYIELKNGHANNPIRPKKPVGFNKMIQLAEKLSKNCHHVRIDFYETNGKIYFGEMTFYHMSGTVPFEPEEWDYKLGNLITLPDKQ